jgi:deoxyribodipyrimidine photolyase-related protein
MKNSILIFGDQLTLENTPLGAGVCGRDVVVLFEARDSATAHKIKRVFQLTAMREFADLLRKNGWEVDYRKLGNTPCFADALKDHLERHSPDSLLVMEPNNWPQQEIIKSIAASGVAVETTHTCQFVTPREEFFRFAKGKKRLLMEAHYRQARQKLGILMRDDGEPEGGSWNYDAENRKTVRDWKKDGAPKPPPAATRRRNQSPMETEVAAEVTMWFPEDVGRAEDCWLPTTREGALEALRDFIENRLPLFGDYQDLMLQDSPTMFHSLIAAPLNLGLLLPMGLIWFPEEIGGFTGYVGRGGRIDTETPPFLVSAAGWILLVGVPAAIYLLR